LAEKAKWEARKLEAKDAERALKKGIEILVAGGFIRVSRVNDKKGKIINPIE